MALLASSSEVARNVDQPSNARAQTSPIAHPGRWVGGAIGVLATALVGGAILAVDALDSGLDLGAAAVVCLLGLPIAFVLGRHLAPIARDGGLGSAVWAGLSFGLLAPILGDVEIVMGSLLAPWITRQSGAEAFVTAPIVLVFGLVFCWLSVPITLAVGFAWVAVMRVMPPDLATRLEVPHPIDHLGVRHAVIALGIWLVVVQLAWALARPPVSW